MANELDKDRCINITILILLLLLFKKYFKKNNKKMKGSVTDGYFWDEHVLSYQIIQSSKSETDLKQR